MQRFFVFTCKLLVESIPLGWSQGQHGGDTALHLLRDSILHQKKKGHHSVRRAQPRGQGILGKGPHPVPESKCTDYGWQNQGQSQVGHFGVHRMTQESSGQRFGAVPPVTASPFLPTKTHRGSSLWCWPTKSGANEDARKPRGGHSCHSDGRRTALVTSPPSHHAFSHWTHVCWIPALCNIPHSTYLILLLNCLTNVFVLLSVLSPKTIFPLLTISRLPLKNAQHVPLAWESLALNLDLLTPSLMLSFFNVTAQNP